MMNLKSTNKELARYENSRGSESSLSILRRHTSCRVKQQRLRNVSFADESNLKIIKRIPKIYSADIWYTVNDMNKFRTQIFACPELRLKVKLKSARCHNHMRRVLLEHRINGSIKAKKVTSTRNLLNLSNVSMRSSMKPRETAMINATKLESEVIADQSVINPTISGACFGPRRHWIFDYYMGSLIDTLCTVI